MYKIEIGNKTGEKREFECDGTANIYALFRELNITDYPYRVKVGQNKNGVSVRIVSDNDFDAAIAKILTNNRDTLSDALTVSHALGEVRDEWMREEIERNALNGQYATKEELYADIRKMKIELSSVQEDFYCPLHAVIVNEDGEERELTAEELTGYESEIRLKLVERQTPDIDMAKYVGYHAKITDKILYAEWAVEEKSGKLYGKISCYLNETLTTEETERLKHAIDGQNSDGFGEGFEQCSIETLNGKLYAFLWDYDDYFLKTSEEMDEYLQKNEIKMGGI